MERKSPWRQTEREREREDRKLKTTMAASRRRRVVWQTYVQFVMGSFTGPSSLNNITFSKTVRIVVLRLHTFSRGQDSGHQRRQKSTRSVCLSPSLSENQSTRTMSLTVLDDDMVRSMSIGAVFSDFVGKINSIDFHRKEDLLVTASEDDSVRFYDIANAKLLKTTYHKKHGADRICFTHHPSSVICSSRHNLESTGESLRYLSMYDNRCLRYFKGHKERVVSLCMSPINDSFMSGSLDHSVRIWDLRVNACQGILRLRGRPTVAYDQQGLVFAVAMEGGAIKLFDSRSYDKGPFDTFLVGGDTAEVCDIKFSNDGKSMLLTTTDNNIYVLDAYGGEKRCGFSLEPSQTTNIEATFTPDGQYVVSGSGDGTIHAWSINMRNEVASWNSNIGVASCLKWAPRRAMFVAASTVLTFWIPDNSKLNAESGSMDTEPATQSQHISQ